MKRRIPLIALALALLTLLSACAMPGMTTNLANVQEGNADMENANKATESNGRVWPWEDTSITLPEFTGTVVEPGTVTSLKIVVMGDKSAKDAWEFFPQIAKEAGIDFKISILCMNVKKSEQASIINHRNQNYQYTHYQNTGDGWVTLSTNTSRSSVLKSENWQYFVINQSIWDSGKANTINDPDVYLSELLRNVKNEIPGTKEKCLWMQTWAYENNSRNNLFNGFKDYGENQTQMFEAINNVIQSCIVGDYYFKQKKEADKVATNALKDSVIPVGTAVQNMREAYWSDGLTRDGEYLSNTGKVLAALMLFKSLTGYDVNGLELSDPVFDHARPHLGVIKESVNNAYLNPYAVTPSVYHTAD